MIDNSVAIEAVGIPETFELCTELVRPGGRVANVGVHGCSATLHLNTEAAYDVFGDAAHTHALEVVLGAHPVELESTAKERRSSPHSGDTPGSTRGAAPSRRRPSSS